MADFTRVGIDAQVYLACGAINGHEQITASRFVLPLWQILDVDGDQAQGSVLERLAYNRRILVLDRTSVQTMAFQTTRQTGTGYGLIEKLPGHHPQVIQRQPQRTANLHGHHLLGRRQGAVQRMRTV